MGLSISAGDLPFLKRAPRLLGIKKHVSFRDTEIGRFLLDTVKIDCGVTFPGNKQIIQPLLTKAYTITGHAFEILIQAKMNHPVDEIPRKFLQKMYAKFNNLTEEEQIEILSTKDKSELKKMCDHRNLKKSGSKPELIDRLIFVFSPTDSTIFEEILSIKIKHLHNSLKNQITENDISIALTLASLTYRYLSYTCYIDELWMESSPSKEICTDLTSLFNLWNSVNRNDKLWSSGEFSMFKEFGHPDFFNEDSILDIKAVVRVRKREHLAQLLGYAFLAKMNGINVEYIQLYYARHGVMLKIPLADAVNGELENKFEQFSGMIFQTKAEGARGISNDEIKYGEKMGYLGKFSDMEEW